MRKTRVFFQPMLLAIALLLASCGTVVNEGVSRASQAASYFQSTARLTIHVAYEPAAEPFVGNRFNGRPLWNILEDNLTAIFQYRTAPPALIVPKTLSSMSTLPVQSRTSWSVNDVLALHAQYGSTSSTASETHFYVYFLDGYYSEGGAPNTGVLGVSFGGTEVVAIFKRVVTSSGGAAVQRYVEQSTLVHELGHALGFVNNGVPMTTAHQDTAHGSHDTDPDCVMYWQNEGAGDLAQFIGKYLTQDSTVMWGPGVLADARALSR